MAHLRCDFYSDSLNLSTSMTVILPQQTSTQIGMAGRAFEGLPPVLYLLHGLSDDDTIWLRRTSIERYAAPLGLAVVMPQVHRSFYTDEVYGQRYWTFLSEELPHLVAGFFRISERRQDTFVAGLSMGGYGAWKWALRQPERFAAAATLSGAVDLTSGRSRRVRSEDPMLFDRVFGSRGSGRRSRRPDLVAGPRRAGHPSPAVPVLRHRRSADRCQPRAGRELCGCRDNGQHGLRSRRSRLGVLGHQDPRCARLVATAVAVAAGRTRVAFIGTNLIFLAPLLVTLALKVNSLVGIGRRRRACGCGRHGSLLAMVANPFFGKMSDRTSSQLGMRRPWMVIGLVGGCLGILIVALAPNIAVVLLGWCIASCLNALLAALVAVLPDQVPAVSAAWSPASSVSLPIASVTGTFLVQLFTGNQLAMFLVPCAIGGFFILLFAVTLNDRRLARRTSRPGHCGNSPARSTSTRGRTRTSPGLSRAASCSSWPTPS